MNEAAQAWSLVQSSEDPAVLEAFRKQYGSGNALYDQLAASRIDAVKQKKAADDEEKDQKAQEAERQRVALQQADDAKMAAWRTDGRWSVTTCVRGQGCEKKGCFPPVRFVIEDRKIKVWGGTFPISESGDFQLFSDKRQSVYDGKLSGDSGGGAFKRAATSDTFACSGTISLKRD